MYATLINEEGTGCGGRDRIFHYHVCNKPYPMGYKHPGVITKTHHLIILKIVCQNGKECKSIQKDNEPGMEETRNKLSLISWEWRNIWLHTKSLTGILQEKTWSKSLDLSDAIKSLKCLKSVYPGIYCVLQLVKNCFKPIKHFILIDMDINDIIWFVSMYHKLGSCF